jgi:hypothetical protein
LSCAALLAAKTTQDASRVLTVCGPNAPDPFPCRRNLKAYVPN